MSFVKIIKDNIKKSQRNSEEIVSFEQFVNLIKSMIRVYK